jgi:hypothetical protein
VERITKEPGEEEREFLRMSVQFGSRNVVSHVMRYSSFQPGDIAKLQFQRARKF